jgi:hypothetical protein
MTTIINPDLIPTILPGQIFSRFANDSTIGIRWLTSADPAFYEAINRPIVDLAVRQLILAKALDNLDLRLGHMALFPFLIPPKLVTNGSGDIDIPLAWIWDLHASMPQKWEYPRLAWVKRLNGTNGGSGGSGSSSVYTGKLRLVFTAQLKGSINEVAVFTAEYDIDSPLGFQVSRIVPPDVDDAPVILDSVEATTIDGFIEFRTLDTADTTVQTFYNALVPPGGGSSGSVEPPSTYELADSPTTSAADTYSLTAVSHGTGLLTASAYNLIPVLDADPNIWLEAFNFPFRISASRTSSTPASFPIVIPKGMFSEMDICSPASDQPTGDTSGMFSPVWVNRIERVDVNANNLKFIFATFNLTDDQASTTPIEFADMTLSRTMAAGLVVEIKAIENLFLQAGSDSSLFQQGFGKGHVVLSTKWGGTSSEISDFFDSFMPIIDDPPAAIFTDEATHLAPFAVSRSPKTAPTYGQAQALVGTAARRKVPLHPSDTNRFVDEQDTGKGDPVDFSSASGGLPPDKRENPDIERYGYLGTLVRSFVMLVVNSSGTDHDYDADILPRLTVLLGRAPKHGDEWFDGTRIKRFIEISSDSPGVWIG